MKRKTKRGLIVAIDGPGGVGKSTVSRMVAEKLHLKYINTGSMYRALALAAMDAGVDLENEEALKVFCSTVEIEFDADSGRISVNGRDYSDTARTQKAGELASIISTKKTVRDFLVGYQRGLGEGGSVVMEGRDIGTVVFPDADIKFFLDASHEARAKRRLLELASTGKAGHVEVSNELRERDRRDRERVVSPLTVAADAIRVDTTEMGVEEVVRKVLKEIDARLKSGNIRS